MPQSEQASEEIHRLGVKMGCQQVANGKRRFNSISSLLINGTHSDSPEVICRSIKQYFSFLFNKPRNPLVNFDWDYLLPRKISNPSILEMVFTEDEVRKSVFSL